MLLLGYDVGTSSIKASLMDAQTGQVVASATSPPVEMEIIAKQPGWAEQRPEIWWEHVKAATAGIREKSAVGLDAVQAIGISYQMHGLVAIDKDQNVLRPSIIWCDSRAVQIGQQAAEAIGPAYCLENFLNYPGNFTASKLRWVQQNEPDIYKKIYKIMVPGDYIAMKMTGETTTTASGLSEGIMWDFQKQAVADKVLENYGISSDMIADIVPTFSEQGVLSKAAAAALGLKSGVVISYRGGDQPNNALSLNVLNPGEVATTAGTSGVVAGVTDKACYDSQSRVNTFVHVNHTTDQPRNIVLLCVNGTGVLNSWLKHNFMGNDKTGVSYEHMNQLAAEAPIGSDGLIILPYGNGAERLLCNRDIGASVHGWNFNVHNRCHFLRAAQEGIVFALNYGFEIMRDMGIDVKVAKAGDANMFLSPLFGKAFATVTGACVELYNTDGSQGAARGAGIGAGIYKTQEQAFVGLKSTRVIEPDDKYVSAYQAAYQNWLKTLERQL
jgi:xylulokinase